MKMLGKIGFILGALTLLFGLYVMFFVVPDSLAAQSALELLWRTSENPSQTEGYAEIFAASERGVDWAGYVFFGSMLPFLMCLIASFKKDKLAIIGLVLSLGAFFIGAAYGTHMFS